MFQSLLSNVAFGFGCSYLALHEQTGVGMHWDNLRTSPITGDDYNLLHVMYMLSFDSILYLFLAWYFEALYPGIYFLLNTGVSFHVLFDLFKKPH